MASEFSLPKDYRDPWVTLGKLQAASPKQMEWLARELREAHPKLYDFLVRSAATRSKNERGESGRGGKP